MCFSLGAERQPFPLIRTVVHRFEEEGGREIGLNPRKVADSLRQGDDKRKRKRAEKKQRLQEERVLRFVHYYLKRRMYT